MATDSSPTPFPNAARIPARTHRQAMDWSLVLASQGIEHVIEQAEDGNWRLTVASQDSERALAAIRLYRLENRHWPWRKTIPKTGAVFDGASAAWVLLIAVFFQSSQALPSLYEAGMTDGAALAGGEWWRLFTATLLHADLAHLAMNAVFGLVLLGLAMGRFGTGAGLLAAHLAGVGGNALAWLVRGQEQRGLGASGVVMGALGLIAVTSLQNPRSARFIIAGVGGGVMLFVLLGLNPEPRTDVVAHLGGFLVGLFLGAVLALDPKLPQRSLINLLAGAMFAMLVILTWALALTQRG